MKCKACPVAEHRPCIGETPGHLWPCQFAIQGDVQRRHVVNRSEIAETAPLPPVLPTGADDESLNVPVDESLRLTALVRKCLFKAKPACGCDTGLCSLKRREVVQFECLACVGKWGW